MSLFRPLALCAALVLMLPAAPAQAQDPVPGHRYLYARDVDYYGADLTNLFDTTQDACERACAAQPACVAFTFNTRNNSCFPKSAVTDQQPYAGAMSARKVATPPQVQVRAAGRMTDLAFLAAEDIDAARTLVETNARRFSFGEETVEDLEGALLRAEERGDTPGALGWAGKAVAATDRADLWQRLGLL